MVIVSYNVNGIRAAFKKGFLTWLQATNPDVICIQETKATPEQVAVGLLEELGYYHYWMPAVKKGYSGVALFTKTKPTNIAYGCNIGTYDDEGRIIRADFDSHSVMSVYVPSGSRSEERQAYKMEWLDVFYDYTTELKQEYPNLVICGDFNICHQEIDIHNPKANKNTSGFLPEERAWISKYIDSGFTDGFRHFNTEPHQYTWWTYRANARSRNLGWRIDYTMATKPLTDKLVKADILADAVHSDHCPILLEVAE